MSSSRAGRKKRKQRRHTAPSSASAPAPASAPSSPEPAEPTMSDHYARAREREEAARAALKPLGPGERPRAVSIGAVVAAVLLLANLATLLIGYDPDQPSKTIYSILGILILGMCAWGMWRVRYWAVLGMQALLAFAIIGASIALIQFKNAGAFVLCVFIIAAAGTLFWFLVKSMARIQMPQRPGAG